MLLSIRIHKVILSIFAVTSLIGNITLIFLVLHKQNRNLGSYRILLVSFAFVDMIISLFHCVAIPVLYQFEFGVIVFTVAGLNHPQGFFINSFYIILYYEPFVLLAFHFVYRYLILVSPLKVQQNGLTFALLAISINILFGCATIVLCLIVTEVDDVVSSVMFNKFHVNMNSSPRPHIFAVHYFLTKGTANWKTLIAFGIATSALSSAVAISAFFAYRITKSISTRVMAIGARRLQLQLFKALVAQFTVPFVLCVIPFAFILLLPFTGFRFGETANVLGIMVSLFPVIDPIMVIAMVPRFRLMIVQYYKKGTGRIPGVDKCKAALSSTGLINTHTTSVYVTS